MTSFSHALQERFFAIMERNVRERFAAGDTRREDGNLFVFDIDDRKDFFVIPAELLSPDHVREIIARQVALDWCGGVAFVSEDESEDPMTRQRTSEIAVTFHSKDRPPARMAIEVIYAKGLRWLGQTWRGDGGKPSSVATWPEFTRNFAQFLAAFEDGKFAGVILKGTNRFVQFMRRDGLGMRGECVSNAYLDGGDRLTDEERACLVAMGWNEPNDTIPNYFVDIAEPVPFEDVAALATRTLVEVHKAKSPQDLRMSLGKRASPDVRVERPKKPSVRAFDFEDCTAQEAGKAFGIVGVRPPPVKH